MAGAEAAIADLDARGPRSFAFGAVVRLLAQQAVRGDEAKLHHFAKLT